MNYLLDTHIFLWYIQKPTKLSVEKRRKIEDSSNDIYLSVASVWEIIIKAKLGRLNIKSPHHENVLRYCSQHDIQLIDISVSDIAHLEFLPEIHKDPFDQILLCQAFNRDLFLITDDGEILKYPEVYKKG